MNSWPSFESFFQGAYNGLHEVQPLCYPMEMNYHLISSSFYSSIDCCPIIPTEVPQESQKHMLPILNTQSKIGIGTNCQKNRTEIKIERSHSKGSKNIKANIFKQFIKTIKKDASCILMVRQTLGIDYSIKTFIEQINRKLPQQGKYIRLKIIENLSHNKDDSDFSKIFRVLLRNFLLKDYKLMILQKKKNRMEFLKACREMFEKIFSQKK